MPSPRSSSLAHPPHPPTRPPPLPTTLVFRAPIHQNRRRKNQQHSKEKKKLQVTLHTLSECFRRRQAKHPAASKGARGRIGRGREIERERKERDDDRGRHCAAAATTAAARTGCVYMCAYIRTWRFSWERHRKRIRIQ